MTIDEVPYLSSEIAFEVATDAAASSVVETEVEDPVSEAPSLVAEEASSGHEIPVAGRNSVLPVAVLVVRDPYELV